MKKHNRKKEDDSKCITGNESTHSNPEKEKEYLENYFTVLANKVKKPKSHSSYPGDRRAPKVHISKL